MSNTLFHEPNCKGVTEQGKSYFPWLHLGIPQKLTSYAIDHRLHQVKCVSHFANIDCVMVGARFVIHVSRN